MTDRRIPPRVDRPPSLSRPAPQPTDLDLDQEIRARALGIACRHLANAAPEATPWTVLDWTERFAAYIRDGSKP